MRQLKRKLGNGFFQLGLCFDLVLIIGFVCIVIFGMLVTMVMIIAMFVFMASLMRFDGMCVSNFMINVIFGCRHLVTPRVLMGLWAADSIQPK
jgi:hypothetical protein